MFIEADLHCHSLASSHAYSTVKELAASAKENGLKMFALTDHASSMEDAPHPWHFTNLSVIPREVCGVRVLRGVEANLRNIDGEIDMSDFELGFVEWVVVSCHDPLIVPGTAEENTLAYINLMKRYEAVDLIGHPTTKRYPVDFDKLAKAAKEYGKFLELNESSLQFWRSPAENCLAMLDACKKYGTQIIVNTDCHFCDIIGKTPTTQKMLEETNFPKELIFNLREENVIEYLAKKKNIII